MLNNEELAQESSFGSFSAAGSGEESGDTGDGNAVGNGASGEESASGSEISSGTAGNGSASGSGASEDGATAGGGASGDGTIAGSDTSGAPVTGVGASDEEEEDESEEDSVAPEEGEPEKTESEESEPQTDISLISSFDGWQQYMPYAIGGAAVIVAAAVACICIKARKRKRIREEQKRMEQEQLRRRQEAEQLAKEKQQMPTGAQEITEPMTMLDYDASIHRGVLVGKVHNIGKRSSQQDAFGLSQDGPILDPDGRGVVAIVADGMGGLSNGADVSTRVTISMLQSFEEQPFALSGDQKLLAMLNNANRDVNTMLREHNMAKSGSTVVAVLIQNQYVYWISVGDSHIYLYRDGALMQVNREHVYAVELDERAARGEIGAREAAEDPQRKALTSYIGMGMIEKIDRNTRPIQVQTHDRILLMSDGVFGTLSDEEITAAMRLPVEESAEAIEQMIQGKNRNAQDNYTALILEYR